MATFVPALVPAVANVGGATTSGIGTISTTSLATFGRFVVEMAPKVLTRASIISLFMPSQLGADDEVAPPPQTGEVDVRFKYYLAENGAKNLVGYRVDKGGNYLNKLNKVKANWDATHKSIIAEVDGVRLTWLPNGDGDIIYPDSESPMDSGITVPNIWIRPIENIEKDFSTPLYGERQLVEHIVTFPPDSGIPPLYLVYSQARGPNGRYVSNGEPKPTLNRSSLRAETKRKIEAEARKDANGNFTDKNGDIIDDWHYGHKHGVENRRIIRAGEHLGMTQEQLNDFVNDHPNYFQIEDKTHNLSHQGEKPGNGDLEPIIREMLKWQRANK